MESTVKIKRPRRITKDQIQSPGSVDYQAKAEQMAKDFNIPIDRVFKNTQKVVSDLCKLTVTNMLKQIPLTNPPEYIEVEHCHFFHTVDSNGKPMTRSTPVAGHFHEMEVIKNKDGSSTIRCGPPVQEFKNKYKKRYTKLADENDTHTHEVTYLRSLEIGLRNTNVEAAKVEVRERQKEEIQISGIQERQ